MSRVRTADIQSRRQLLAGSLGAFCVYALLAEARAAIPPGNRPPAASWIARQDELARGLRDGSVSQRAWHDAVNALARDVDVAALAVEIRRAILRSAGAPFGHDPQKRFVAFRDEQGAPVHVSYGTALFSFSAESAITPHAHKHMASAHMVIEGKVRIRTFDRVADEFDAIRIRPTRDEVAEVGDAAAMTTAKDNVHWFVPKSANAMTFDVIVDGLDPGAESYLIQPVDPVGGRKNADGTISAPIISFEESMKRYPASF
jgi:hypothetical protein